MVGVIRTESAHRCDPAGISGSLPSRPVCLVSAADLRIGNKYDQNRLVRALGDPSLPSRELKSISATFLHLLKLQQQIGSFAGAAAADPVANNFADLVESETRREKERERDEALARCRPDGADAAIATSE